VINDFTNITSNGSAFAELNSTNYTATLKAGFACTLPSSITIEMGGIKLISGTHYTYNNSTGELIITEPVTGDIKISADGVMTKKSVTTTLTNAKSNGESEIYPALGNYITNLIPDNGYKLPETVNVKIGTTILDNTDYKYNAKTGELIVFAKNITDDITIEVIAVEAIYKVVFDSNGGFFANETDTLTFEDSRTIDYNNLEKPTRSEYKFIGYFTEKIGGTSLESYIAEAGIDDDLTFYAQWEKLEPLKLFEMSKNQEFIIGEDGTLIFYLDNDRGTGKVFVNNEELNKEKGDYTWEYVEGIYPTIILSEDYIKTLKVGKYNIEFILDNGRKVETTFTVTKEKTDNKENTNNTINQGDSENSTTTSKQENSSINSNNPKTGDNILIFVTIFLISTLGIIIIANYRKKYKNR